MPAQPKKPEESAPEPVIIVKKIVAGDGGHHGGAWKVAYADFVTAMMAFFMLLWILGATTEKQRQGIADYFSPTLVKMKSASSGSNGVLAGQSLTEAPGSAPAMANGRRGAAPTLRATTLRTTAGGTVGDAKTTEEDRRNFGAVKEALEKRLAADKDLRDLKDQVRYTETREGLRIEILDRAGFSMFALGTDVLYPRAGKLMAEVARSVRGLDNPIAIRGHTDSLNYGPGAMNNWKLSVQRAEATRAVFGQTGVAEARFARLEGVADQEPYAPKSPADPRNRRITVTLLYRDR